MRQMIYSMIECVWCDILVFIRLPLYLVFISCLALLLQITFPERVSGLMLPFTLVSFISFSHQSSVYNLLQVLIKRAFLLFSFSTSLPPLRREERSRRRGGRIWRRQRRRGGGRVRQWFDLLSTPSHKQSNKQTDRQTDRHYLKADSF